MAGLIVGLVVMAVLPATAATGDVAKMGQWNRAGTQTVFSAAAGTTLQVRNTRTTGIPLRLIGDASMPPMQVSSDVLVANLNADLLDGMEASAFAAGIHGHGWSDLTSGIPAGLSDGDDDTVGALDCDPGQVPKRNPGDTAWECAADEDTVYADGDAVAAVLAADGTDSGLDADLLDGQQATYFATSGHDHDLADLGDTAITSIGIGELLRWTGTAWVNATLAEAGIAAVGHGHGWSDLTSGVPAGLSDGDDDALGTLDCDPGQVAKRNVGDTGWECGDDAGGTDADTLDGLDSTDFLGADQQATDSARLGGARPGLYVGGWVADADGLPILGVGCLHQGGSLMAVARDGSPYCSPAGGSGTFAGSGQSIGSSSGYGVALGDLDGDGDLDAFVANYTQANRVWFNDGRGWFTDSGQALGSSFSYAVALGDLDGDGDLDAFEVNASQADQVWINDGTGAFTNTQSLGSQAGRDVALGDVDGDGDLDAFVANDGQGNQVWLNDGFGSFSTSGQSLGTATSRAVALGDLDGDGDLDAYLANNNDPDEVWLNDGGTFTDSGQALACSAAVSAAIADLDGDGDLDVVAGRYNQGNKVWLNDGTGTLSSTQALGTAASAGVALGDFDGDGTIDLFVANAGSADKLWLNDGSGTFTDSGQSLGSAISNGLDIGDLDGDGDLDAFVVIGNAADVVWLNS